MQPVNARLHAMLARQLIEACGGLEESETVSRLKRSRLSECQTPGSGAYLPIDVVADLEAYCGRPIYSQALVDARPAVEAAAGIMQEACEATEETGALLRVVRQAVADGHLTPRERDLIEAAIGTVSAELRQLAAAAKRGTP